MPWDIPLFSSIALLVLLQGSKINAVSQESVYVIECIRDMIPMQIFNECCVRENNCTISRQQNKGIDCMSRMIMTNYSWAFLNSHNSGSWTTESPYQFNNQNFDGDVLETLAEICRRQEKGRLQNCIRNELIKRCRYSMLQDRMTSPPGRWNSNGGYSPFNNDRYGFADRNNRRRYNHYQFYGNRRNQDGYNRNDYGDSQYYPRGNYNEESDEEDFGFSDGDSMRYKYIEHNANPQKTRSRKSAL